MKALTWPTDALVRVTSTAICGSHLHLSGVLAPYLTPGARTIDLRGVDDVAAR